MKTLINVFFALLIFIQPFFAQFPPEIYCTTPGDPSEPGWVDWLKNENETGPFFITLKFHSNLQTVTTEVIQSVVNDLGQYYDPENIFFGWDCTIYANALPSDGGNQYDPTVMTVEIISGSVANGLATEGSPGTKLWVTEGGLDITLAHELGHALGLHHVFREEDPATGIGCSEWVDRSSNGNWDTCGDCLWDTDASPETGIGNFDFSTCTYTGRSPSSHPLNFDEQGVRYDPGPTTISNIMNYTLDCRSEFTSQQGNRMRNMLANAEHLAQLAYKDDPNVYLNDLDRVIENATKPDCENGSIDLIVDGGYGPFTYLWSNGETTKNINGLEEGLYCVTVTDVFCNSITGCFSVKCQCFPGVIDLQFFPGASNTTKTLNVLFPVTTGIAFPLTVSISNGSNPITINNPQLITFEDLEIGEYYCLTFTDSNGCSFEDCFVIEGETCPGAMKVSLDRLGHDVDCRSEGDGFIKINIETEDENCRYSTSWNTTPVQKGNIARDLSPGTYCVFVKGKKNSACENCLAVKCWKIGETITDPEPIEIIETFRDICFEDNNGVIHWTGILTLEITGGAGPYTFDWDIDPIASNQKGSDYNFIFNEEGTYCVTITDECGTEERFCYTIVWQRYILDATGEMEIRECLSQGGDGTSLVDPNGGNNKLSVEIHPNPFDNNVNLFINSELQEESQILIFNTIGEKITEKKIQLSKGDNVIEILELSNESSGIYFVQINAGSTMSTIKVLKTN